MITVGEKAPAFALKDQDDRTVRLSQFAGQWVVLYFYPRDDTPGCTKEACEFSADLGSFGELDAVVLGCSPDDPARHRAFIRKHALQLTLLSDPERTVMQQYGAWGEKKLYGKTTVGVIRSTVLIDGAGAVAHHWRAVRAAGHAEKVREKLRTLRAAAAPGI